MAVAECKTIRMTSFIKGARILLPGKSNCLHAKLTHILGSNKRYYSLYKPPFGVRSGEIALNCSEQPKDRTPQALDPKPSKPFHLSLTLHRHTYLDPGCLTTFGIYPTKMWDTTPRKEGHPGTR